MGIRYDADLARAELDRASILIQHHLRHILANGDLANAEYFNTSLQKLRVRSENVFSETRRKVIANRDRM